MDNIVVADNYDLPSVKIWNGQRVVTFKDIDAVHQRPSGTAKAAFNRNRKHFIKDVDYFIVTRSEVKKYVKDTFKNFGDIPKRGVTVLTETGYLMVVKPFNDDLSWNVQRQLVNSYFKAKENIKDISENGYKSIKVNPWLAEMESKFKFLCKEYGFDRKKLYHKILLDIGKKYNVDDYKILYKYMLGHDAKYIMEVVAHFQELREEAEKTINIHVERKIHSALIRAESS